ncbi:hypothetical protein [Leucobacter luti]|uniref:Uncharacterized protein n=1 Tax=Leucobacter luti TaxID=340320 RepID=A0A4R6RXA8_9MICO|nr:hypothetical protein [Leucobacter luti]MCW2288371.1 hypothetical protein [Leucobacter luti]QYM75684.1 hypothetical protein K1X41_13895 [Leucobacter luti]TCK45472.1 hypothetical protein EDF60_0699 [Leucobacter luti]TDP91623.1 hypothetical protein EDF62_2242 [Leucobacter luti]
MNKENDSTHDEDATANEPVMDGAEEHDAEAIDPRKGMSDPALIRHPSKHDKNTAPYNL